jgi:hypothetical protein
MYSSACFGRPHAHHQELNNCSSSLCFYRWSVVVAVLWVVVGPAGWFFGNFRLTYVFAELRPYVSRGVAAVSCCCWWWKCGTERCGVTQRWVCVCVSVCVLLVGLGHHAIRVLVFIGHFNPWVYNQRPASSYNEARGHIFKLHTHTHTHSLSLSLSLSL